MRRAAARALYGGCRHGPEKASRLARRLHGVEGEGILVGHMPSTDAVLRYAVTEDRPYDEKELTARLARMCGDYSALRRKLIEDGLMRRESGTYVLTELGRLSLRVERYIQDRYLAR